MGLARAWPDLRYCTTEGGTAAAAMCATTCTKRLRSPACSPKSYQCSARVPRGAGSLSRGIRLSVFGTSSATWDKKRFDTGGLCRDSRVRGGWIQAFDFLHKLPSDQNWWSPDGARVAILRTPDCLFGSRFARGTEHSARTVAQRAGQSSDQKRSSRASRKCAQVLCVALTAGTSQEEPTAEHEECPGCLGSWGG